MKQEETVMKVREKEWDTWKWDPNRNCYCLCGFEATGEWSAGALGGAGWAMMGPWEESALNRACSLSPCFHSSPLLFPNIP